MGPPPAAPQRPYSYPKGARPTAENVHHEFVLIQQRISDLRQAQVDKEKVMAEIEAATREAIEKVLAAKKRARGDDEQSGEEDDDDDDVDGDEEDFDRPEDAGKDRTKSEKRRGC